MKKKIKDLTIGELISIARKTIYLQESGGNACSECPLEKVEYIECWEYCSKSKYQAKKIDYIINQEIEVNSDEEKD